MYYRAAKITDLQEIKKLLKTSNLPSGDCVEHLDNFIVVENSGEIIGVGGFEIYGGDGLLRSIVVAPNNRGKGIGGEIYKLIEQKASSLRVGNLFLLTESAEKYFLNLEFSVISRVDVPASIKGTKQFKELCPSSATVMRCVI
ncbi:MAG: GNAT family N-acetyltransferase [Ectothiorhodospiraceae bacterium]|nr:GNAT family N-acetyltransferase [Ectothiorhodospiraceae bacterium]